MYFIYDVCVHDDGDYREQSDVKFVSSVHVGDFIKNAAEDTEYEVFKVVHSDLGGESVIHIRPLSANQLSVL